ncbi:DUF4400 domain-containing protein [Thiorhodococcus minor]|uniref:DUF4400 domain-containing protein n=1 Tax=Thiorhodococcus minor TaxID=57489 RepID=A0A6M0JSX2_9GAMM|nr:DUF4400 domain-containing protein [Thiorhodococcus minor]NEV60329.1 DUF4400 domain-containing protein [Thiorhodococcus minor]
MAEPSDHDATPMLALLRWVLLLLVLGAFGLVWIPADWPVRVLAVERHWCLSGLGTVTGPAVLQQAARWSAESDADHVSEPTVSASIELKWLIGVDAASWGAGWSADRLALLTAMHELLILRLTLLAAWGPALLMLLAAAVLDGHWWWRIRQCGFDYPSPIGRQASATGAGLLILVLVLELGLPVPLHPCLLPIGVVMAAVLIATGIRHLPKQL